MSLTYHRDKSSVPARLRRGPARRTFFIISGVLFVGAIVLAYPPLRAMITRGAYLFAPRVWQIGDRISSAGKNILSSFASKQTLVEENRILREEVSRMQAQMLDRNLLEEKARELEEKLGRANTDDRVIANVLVGPGRSPYDVFVIDAGEDHGVAHGDRVVYAGAGAIGEIVEVYGASSKAKLFSSPGEQLPVLVGTTTIPTIATGRGMGNFEARVPQGSSVLTGENVITSENLIVGTVGAVLENEAMPFIRVLFALPFNIAEVRTVEVIKGHTNDN